MGDDIGEFISSDSEGIETIQKFNLSPQVVPVWCHVLDLPVSASLPSEASSQKTIQREAALQPYAQEGLQFIEEIRPGIAVDNKLKKIDKQKDAVRSYLDTHPDKQAERDRIIGRLEKGMPSQDQEAIFDLIENFNPDDSAQQIEVRSRLQEFLLQEEIDELINTCVVVKTLQSDKTPAEKRARLIQVFKIMGSSNPEEQTEGLMHMDPAGQSVMFTEAMGRYKESIQNCTGISGAAELISVLEEADNFLLTGRHNSEGNEVVGINYDDVLRQRSEGRLRLLSKLKEPGKVVRRMHLMDWTIRPADLSDLTDPISSELLSVFEAVEEIPDENSVSFCTQLNEFKCLEHSNNIVSLKKEGQTVDSMIHLYVEAVRTGGFTGRVLEQIRAAELVSEVEYEKKSFDLRCATVEKVQEYRDRKIVYGELARKVGKNGSVDSWMRNCRALEKAELLSSFADVLERGWEMDMRMVEKFGSSQSIPAADSQFDLHHTEIDQFEKRLLFINNHIDTLEHNPFAQVLREKGILTLSNCERGVELIEQLSTVYQVIDKLPQDQRHDAINVLHLMVDIDFLTGDQVKNLYKLIFAAADIPENSGVDVASIQPFECASVYKKREDDLLQSISKELVEKILPLIPEKERAFYILASNGNRELRKWLLENRSNCHIYLKDGKLTSEFFDAIDSSMVDEAVLTDEVLDGFSPEKKAFWHFYLSFDDRNIKGYLKSNADKVIVKYYSDGTIDSSALLNEYFKEMIVTPENMKTWHAVDESLRRLSVFKDSQVRAVAYIRIAEALSVQVLTSRSEVEELALLEKTFARLYRPSMPVLERQAWNLLRKKMPFALDDMLLEQMKRQAVVVEQENRIKLSWVHEAVHNFVRAQTPDYIRALHKWLETGSESAAEELKSLAHFYPFDSKPPSDFYTEESRLSLQAALPEISQLVELVEGYYEVKPEKLTSMREWFENSYSLKDERGKDLLARIKKMERSLQEAQQNRVPQEYLEFIRHAYSVRSDLLAIEGSDQFREDALMLDVTISGLYKIVISEYATAYLEPRLKEDNLSQEDMYGYLEVVKSCIECGGLEGEITEYSDMLRTLSEIVREKDIMPLNRADMHKVMIQAMPAQFQEEVRWREFMNFAEEEMTAMFVRMGNPPEKALEQIRQNDLVNYEKNSYQFALKPLLDYLPIIANEAAETASPISSHIVYERLLGKVTESPYGDLQRVSRVIGEITSQHMPDDLQEASAFLSKLAKSSYAQADKLCRIVVPDYLKKEGKRLHMRVEVESADVHKQVEVLELIPFSHYGVECVVVLKNGKVAQDPLAEIKEVYARKIVPAMEKTLREGD